MTLIKILNELEATTKRTEKLAILEKNKDNKDLKEFFRLALDPFTNFYIKKIPSYNEEEFGPIAVSWAFEQLFVLSSRQLTGNAAIERLAYILSHMATGNAEVLKRVIAKDPKCGVAAATVNSVWGKNFIPKFPVMKASPYDEKTIKSIEFPAYSQTKIDGARCQIVTEDGKVTVYSSNGNVMEVHGVFDWLPEKFVINCVVDGELVVKEADGSLMDRKKGNGIINKAVKGTLSPEESKRLHLIAFDLIYIDDWKRGKSTDTYEERWFSLNKMYVQALCPSNMSMVDTIIVKNEKEAVAHFKELYANGEEGTILKNTGTYWEGKRSKEMVKFKGILTTDLKVVKVEEGSGKYEGKIGSLVCESSDGEVRVNVGSGLSDSDRAMPFDSFVGRIVEVAYNEKILSKVEGAKYSLFLPRFVEVRTDKDYSDSIKEIV